MICINPVWFASSKLLVINSEQNFDLTFGENDRFSDFPNEFYLMIYFSTWTAAEYILLMQLNWSFDRCVKYSELIKWSLQIDDLNNLNDLPIFKSELNLGPCHC